MGRKDHRTLNSYKHQQVQVSLRNWELHLHDPKATDTSHLSPGRWLLQNGLVWVIRLSSDWYQWMQTSVTLGQGPSEALHPSKLVQWI